ncbi:Ribonuclease E/G-like protein chloroplastic [Zea mays]|uniref:Ribonuclease E/G-like protein chloroplastic n=1 Tax=Zea mays TaxID=4577 RepID=A0A1D6KLZ1_MAIZE|nr:Ribonuclease E/G-like protein chloroplastic [Zea mays]
MEAQLLMSLRRLAASTPTGAASSVTQSSASKGFDVGSLSSTKGPPSISISDVPFVPDPTIQLMSASQLIDHDCCVILYPNFCYASVRVPLNNGGSLVIEQTEALVSVDVNGGHSMFGQGTSQEKAILEVNLEAAKQIARELRLRDIGGIIIVDFIDMSDDLSLMPHFLPANKKLVYEEMKKAVEKDRSTVGVSELSKLGLMEITRKRLGHGHVYRNILCGGFGDQVRPSVTFMISEPCTCCHGTGRVEALDTSFSKIEREICRRLAASRRKSDPEKPKSWPRFLLRVDHEMCTYLTSGKKTKLGLLSSSLKVWILLKIARGFSRGAFELLPYSEKENYSMEKETSELPQKESRPKLSVFPIKKWMSRAKRAK